MLRADKNTGLALLEPRFSIFRATTAYTGASLLETLLLVFSPFEHFVPKTPHTTSFEKKPHPIHIVSCSVRGALLRVDCTARKIVAATKLILACSG